ncbi:MAG TPA: MauE/DoxX family redox-associated membrane protein [Verrucomicrobiales bacterium]|nr:MauE/DoxX family redox-associated membrane protein [Verrucomicrobiales bacterium]
MLQSRRSFSFLLRLPRIGLAAVFLVSGAIKVLDPTAFLLQVRAYDLLPDPGPGILSLLLPWLEVFAGASLFLRPLQGGACLLLGALLLLFSAALASAWSRGLEIACGCFGAVPVASFPLHILLNAILFACSLFAFRQWRLRPRRQVQNS